MYRPMRVHFYVRNMAHHERTAGAMEAGLAVHGIRMEKRTAGNWGQVPDVAITWSVKYPELEAMRRQYGTQWLVCEAGYFGDRANFPSLGWNGLNGRAEFHNQGSPPDRWAKHGTPVKPWRAGGDYVLILGQVPGDASHRHANLVVALAQAAAEAREAFNLPVRYRPHPKGAAHIPGLQACPYSELDDALDHAALAVTFNSNSAVDAVLAGVPTVTLDQGSMAWPVTGHSASEYPPTPDRTQWLRDLAYCQWLPEEIASGEAWAHIGARHECT